MPESTKIGSLALPAPHHGCDTADTTLDAARLSPLAEAAVQALLREGESSNTVASYRAALRYWAAWFALRYQAEIRLPVSPATVLQFIVDHVARSTEAALLHELPASLDALLVAQGFKGRIGPLALATVGHRIAVLSKVHAQHQVLNPCRDEAVRDLLSKTRRAYAKRAAPTARKDALTREPLDALLATCDGSLRGLRDRALLLFAWASGGRRRSEVVQASLENTRKIYEGEWSYCLQYDKTNQLGSDRAENYKPLVGIAAAALEAWLAASGIEHGPLFRRIRKGTTVGEPLAASAVRKIVIERCRLAGLSGDYSAHSLRSGFVTEAGRQNVPLGDTMALTGHASVATVMKYFRSGQASASRAARLFETSQS
jgi:integrase